jgi:hypothetical protein
MWRKVGPASCIYDERAIQMGSGLQVQKPDVDLMAKVIPAPPEKFADKESKSVQERVTYLENVVEREIPLEEVRNIYVEAIEKTFQVKLESGELSAFEKRLFEEMKDRYTSTEFFMERSEGRRFNAISQFASRKATQFKIPGGPFIRIVLLVDKNIIMKGMISGSIHASPLTPTSPIHEIEKALENHRVDESAIESTVRGILNRPGFVISGVSSEILARRIYQCACQGN